MASERERIGTAAEAPEGLGDGRLDDREVEGGDDFGGEDLFLSRLRALCMKLKGEALWVAIMGTAWITVFVSKSLPLR